MIPSRDNNFVEIDYSRRKKRGEGACGDTFLLRRIPEEKRSVAVLSDGLGSGIKAAVLSSLTSVMASRFTSSFRDLEKSAAIIMQTLPVCSQRKISYATFTIIDIDSKGRVRLLEYDNPPSVLIRDSKVVALNYSEIKGRSSERDYTLKYSEFSLLPEDRIILFSDGVVQAGLGGSEYPKGWGYDNAVSFILNCIDNNPDISATALSEALVNKAVSIDSGEALDDISSGVIYFRRPRELLLLSGPPIEPENDRVLADKLLSHRGMKAVCGGTTSEIISRETGIPINSKPSESSGLPASKMEGVDILTEGVITLRDSLNLLRDGREKIADSGGSAKELTEILLSSDIIEFLIGTKINVFYESRDLPPGISLRRTIIEDMVRILENEYGKETSISYI